MAINFVGQSIKGIPEKTNMLFVEGFSFLCSVFVFIVVLPLTCCGPVSVSLNAASARRKL